MTMTEAFWTDKRTIDEMKFGMEFKPTLAEVMKEHPWPDSAFEYLPPVFTYVPSVPPHNGLDEDRAAKQAEFDAWAAVPANLEAYRLAQFNDWKKRMAEIPTNAALEAWKHIHEDDITSVHMMLARCGVKTAEDLKKLGCTGATAFGLSIDEIQVLRMGLAGSGVGLACFVPPSRYCLAHEVTGGLQEGQVQGYPNLVNSISRELTPAEAAHGKLVEEAQWKGQSGEAFRVLKGKTLPEDWTRGDELIKEAEAIRAAAGPDIEPVRLGAPTWTCAEHKKTNWACRYCVAQAVVEGDIEPVYRLAVGTARGDRIEVTDVCAGGKLVQEIADEDAQGTSGLDVFVRVATFKRKLARD